MRVRIETLGCRLNIGEMETLARQLTAAGHRVVGPGEPAELCVLNSCTVTAEAARKSRRLVRQLRRAAGDAPVVVTGCWSELAADAARDAGVDLVVPNHDKDRLDEVLETAGLLRPAAGGDALADQPVAFAPGGVGRTRGFVKVQDGCDNRCTFCIVTVARGAGRSRPAGEVVAEIHRLSADGVREVVLSGVHLGSYGHDRGDRHGLVRLVRRILAETDVERLRLSSLEPWDLDGEFVALLAEPRLQPHLHLPLQSGCDATLRRMARRTTTSGFTALLAAARAARPGLAVSTDVMVGFPGETDDEFRRSFEYVAAAGFSRLHVFRFSPRAGTRAAVMPAQVAGDVAQQRSRRMLALGAELEERCNRGLVGTTAEVLWESAEPWGDGLRWSGLTGSYVRVVTETATGVDLANRVTPTEIRATAPGAVWGSVAGVSTDHEIPEPRPGRTPPVVRSA